MTKTILRNRDLFFDGSSAFSEAELLSLALKGITPKKAFGKTKFTGFKEKSESKPLPEKEFLIPAEYLCLDLDILFDGLLKDKNEKEVERAKYELNLYRERGIDDSLRLMVYIKDVFSKNNIVFGVGRGSSVSSYLLFLLEIHLVDSLKYDLDVHDFIRS